MEQRSSSLVMMGDVSAVCALFSHSRTNHEASGHINSWVLRLQARSINSAGRGHRHSNISAGIDCVRTDHYWPLMVIDKSENKQFLVDNLLDNIAFITLIFGSESG